MYSVCISTYIRMYVQCVHNYICIYSVCICMYGVYVCTCVCIHMYSIRPYDMEMVFDPKVRVCR